MALGNAQQPFGLKILLVQGLHHSGTQPAIVAIPLALLLPHMLD